MVKEEHVQRRGGPKRFKNRDGGKGRHQNHQSNKNGRRNDKGGNKFNSKLQRNNKNKQFKRRPKSDNPETREEAQERRQMELNRSLNQYWTRTDKPVDGAVEAAGAQQGTKQKVVVGSSEKFNDDLDNYWKGFVPEAKQTKA